MPAKSAMLLATTAALLSPFTAEAKTPTATATTALKVNLTRKEALMKRINVTTVPDDAPPHYPFASAEDFFENYGLDYNRDLMPTNDLKCSTLYPGGKVYTINDGVNTRCFVAIVPTTMTSPGPVLYFSHGSGGSAWKCGEAADLTGTSWVNLAEQYGFIFVCGEAIISSAVNDVTGAILTGGVWSMPEVFNDSSGPNCDLSLSVPGGIELQYYRNMIAEMEKHTDIFDTSRIYTHGCSQGSAMTIWQTVCHHIDTPSMYPAMATHSTGLKIKGDGNQFPPCGYDPTYTWGECPTCKYWPTVPSSIPSGLKACIFDNIADPQSQNPLFYRSSQQLDQYYKQLGLRSETHYSSGGHCVVHSNEEIATCLDDGTRHLTPNAPACTDNAPSSDYTCAEQKQLGKCSKSWMVGFCCDTCFDCAAGCGQ